MKLIELLSEESGRQKRARLNQEDTYYRVEVSYTDFRGEKKRGGFWTMLRDYPQVWGTMDFINEPFGLKNKKEVLKDSSLDYRFYFTEKGYKKFHNNVRDKVGMKLIRNKLKDFKIHIVKKRIKDKHVKYKDDYQIVIYKDFDKNARYSYIYELMSAKRNIDNEKEILEFVKRVIADEMGKGKGSILKTSDRIKNMYFTNQGYYIMRKLLKEIGYTSYTKGKNIRDKDIVWKNMQKGILYQVSTR